MHCNDTNHEEEEFQYVTKRKKGKKQPIQNQSDILPMERSMLPMKNDTFPTKSNALPPTLQKKFRPAPDYDPSVITPMDQLLQYYKITPTLDELSVVCHGGQETQPTLFNPTPEKK